MKKWIVALLVIVFFTRFGSAAYINGEIRLDEQGFATFNVKTDLPFEAEGLKFEENKLTGRIDTLSEKREGVWTFSLKAGNYDDIFLDVRLPSSTEKITSIKGNNYLFDTEEKVLTLIDKGELDFEVSYKVRETKNYTLIYYLIGVVLLVAVLFVIYRVKRKKDRLNYLMPLINENEQKIIDLLMKGSARQKAVREKLGLAKASFSRYIVNLEKKKLIIREGDGKNKILQLK